MKKVLFLVSAILTTTLTWGTDLTGTVKTDQGAGIANAVVSDGYSVVQTDANGYYSMPYNQSAAYVFVSVPSGYDFPTDDTGFPKIWQRLNKAQSTQTYHFTLHPQDDGGKADSAHVLLVFGDPQVLNQYDLWRFKTETVEDIKKLKASYPAGTRFVGITVGDVVWDAYGFFGDQKAIYESMGIPNFIAIGNHDHNSGAAKQPTQQKQDSVASQLFESTFGPTYYSFNMGAMHYVILDNVYYKGNKTDGKGYDCALTDKQKEWVKKDIAQVQKGTQVVYAMHIPGTNNTSDLQLLQKLVDSLGCTNYIISGHVHANSISVQKTNFTEHNIGACQGSYWSCDWSGDGSPNGYKVFETSPEGIANWYYKGTGWDQDFCLTTFPVGSIDAGNKKTASVLANVWDYHKDGKVQIRVDGVLKNMTKFTADGTDPDLYDLMKAEGDSRPNYPGLAGGTIQSKNPGTMGTKHLFAYKPKNANSATEVVYTDKFGKVTIVPILRHMMVASFSQDTVTKQWSYQQDFNHLPSYPNYIPNPGERRGTWVAGHTPKGWYAAYSNDRTKWFGYDWLLIDNGAQNKAWVKSFGSVSNSSALNGTERSLGSLNLSDQQHISYGIIIENNTGNTISSLDVSYTGEVWRVGSSNTAKESLQVSYAILTDDEARQIRDRETWIGQILTANLPSLTFTTPDNLTAKTAGQTNTAIDGNLAANQQYISGKIDLSLAPGQVLLIRWDDDLATADKDQALAVDDVKLIPTFSTDLPQEITSLTKRTQGARVVWIEGEVQILTDHNTYSITGQKK